MEVWLVTGGSGFLGRHLLAELTAHRPADVNLIAVGRRMLPGWRSESFVELDLEDRTEISRIFKIVRPRYVFHLAGKTPPGSADEFDRLNHRVTSGLFESLAAERFKCRVILAGSAAELGPVPVGDLPVAEDYPGQASESYGVSKLRASKVALAAEPPLEAVVARVFNPIGPGLPTSQALGRFAAKLASGDGPVELEVGDLDARRDFIDVRDVAFALRRVATHGRAGQVYHVGTGRSRPVREGLDFLIRLSGREVRIKGDPSLTRSRGLADSRADIRKLTNQVGWTPTISWEQSLRDLWADARDRSRAGLTDPPAPV